MNTRLVVVGIALGMIGTTTQACSIASDTIIRTEESPIKKAKDAGAATEDDDDKGAAAAGKTCSGDDFVKPDLSKLTACESGKGHCFDATKTPNAEQLIACDKAGTVCVPDEILEANGKPLKSCKSLIGPGGCVTADLFPQVKKEPGSSALTKDVCDADQLCLPCVDPRAQADTPFCKPIGVHANACSGGADTTAAAPVAQETCCSTNGKSAGICLLESGVPEGMRDQVKSDTCSGGNKCVPAAMVSGKPVTCDAGLLGGRGVCMDKCFNDMMSMAGSIGFLSSDGCGSTEVCVPCLFMPKDGIPVPGCS